MKNNDVGFEHSVVAKRQDNGDIIRGFLLPSDKEKHLMAMLMDGKLSHYEFLDRMGRIEDRYDTAGSMNTYRKFAQARQKQVFDEHLESIRIKWRTEAERRASSTHTVNEMLTAASIQAMAIHSAVESAS